MSRHKPIDPEIALELDELEAALNGDAGADPQLLELVAGVRAQAPVIDPRFQAELQSGIAGGFAQARRRQRGGGATPWRPWLAASGVAAGLTAMVMVIAISAGGDGSPAGDSGASSEAEPAAVSGAVAEKARQQNVAPQAGVGDDAAGAARRVERAAQLSLTTSPDNVQSVADGVVRDTQALGGYVASSKVTTSAADSTARFTLRIPVARLDEAIASLSKLANVGALSQDSTDITSPYLSATNRLRAAKAERQGLLKALANASSSGEIASLKQQLAINQHELAAITREVRQLDRRSSMATVAVDVAGDGERKGASGWSIGLLRSPRWPSEDSPGC